MNSTYKNTVTLCRDPDLKSTNSGKLISTCTVFYNQKAKADKDGSTLCFIEVEAWEKTGEELAKLDKGDIIEISGDLIQRRWKDTENRNQMKFLINVRSFTKKGQTDKPAEYPY